MLFHFDVYCPVNGTYLILAHLEKDSILVDVGEHVTQGTKIELDMNVMFFIESKIEYRGGLFHEM